MATDTITRLEVTVAGSVDPTSGFVVDLKDLKEISSSARSFSIYDHRHLNLEVPEFKSIIPTTENMAVAIWHRLDDKIPHANLAPCSRLRDARSLRGLLWGTMKAHLSTAAITSAPRIASTPRLMMQRRTDAVYRQMQSTPMATDITTPCR